jgi:bacterioferritin-associated ferredoxin
MIICSCNVLSVQDIRIAMTTPAPPHRISELFRHLGCRAQCGHCARSVRQVMDELPSPTHVSPRPGNKLQGVIAAAICSQLQKIDARDRLLGLSVSSWRHTSTQAPAAVPLKVDLGQIGREVAFGAMCDGSGLASGFFT